MLTCEENRTDAKTITTDSEVAVELHTGLQPTEHPNWFWVQTEGSPLCASLLQTGHLSTVQAPRSASDSGHEKVDDDTCN